MEKVNVIIGRFQPLTLGHIKGAEYVYKEYGLKTVLCIIDTPSDKLDERHPFPSSLITKHCTSGCHEPWFAGMYPIKNADIGKIADVCREHDFEPVMWTCGSDRYSSYKRQEKYIDKYNLSPDFKVVEIPRTDDDISATKVREAIKRDDIGTYKKMMPTWAHAYIKDYKPYISVFESRNETAYTNNAYFRANLQSFIKEGIIPLRDALNSK